MSLCLQITFSVGLKEGFLRNYVLKTARKCEVEGSAKFIQEDKVRVIACGSKDQVDSFVDEIHRGSAKYELDDIELEPFLTHKDYRGVFRVIE